MSGAISASAQDMPAAYEQLVKAATPDIIAWRRYFHEHPELGNREVNTAKTIQDKLTSWGIPSRIVAKTGVVGILKGGRPGPVVALRADMDGLPVTERVNLAFKSTAKGEYNGQPVGVMHACGHDSHMAMLLCISNHGVTLERSITNPKRVWLPQTGSQ
jgi:amidohydrolase